MTLAQLAAMAEGKPNAAGPARTGTLAQLQGDWLTQGHRGGVIRARTWRDDLRYANERVGRMIAPLVGLDYDEMADMEARGIKLGIMPAAGFLEPSGRFLPIGNRLHHEYLMEVGLMKNPDSHSEFLQALNKSRMIRVDQVGDSLDISLAHLPTAEQQHALAEILKSKKSVNFDIEIGPRPKWKAGFRKSVDDFINALVSFY